MNSNHNEFIIKLFDYLGVSTSVESLEYVVISLVILILLATSSHLLARMILSYKFTRLTKFTKNKWDDVLLEKGVFKRLAHLVPVGILYFGKFSLYQPETSSFLLLSLITSLYFAITIFMVFSALLSAIEAIYNQSRLSKKAPITGFIQVARLLFSIALIFFLVSLLLGKSPIYLLSGLTAIAAVLLLIFRDTILGFVAGIQIAANRMFNNGDWIEISKFGVDGEITQIGLTVVKVQNWDKTISTLPTYTLTSDAVKNYRGMQESGGRRIKRSIFIDIKSIGFASQDQLVEWTKIRLLQDYLRRKTDEISQDTETRKLNGEDIINSRKLTNIGTFRAYCTKYLDVHPDIHENLTKMVRQLAPTEVGLPLEIYCFSNKQAWTDYEHVQAEIFDHLLSIMPIFGLKVYQRISN